MIDELNYENNTNTKKKLTLNGNKALHEDLTEYGQPSESATDTTNRNMIRIHSHHINNMPQYATYIKNRSISNELKKRQLIYTYGRKLGSVGQKWIQLIIRSPEQKDWEFIQTSRVILPNFQSVHRINQEEWELYFLKQWLHE